MRINASWAIAPAQRITTGTRSRLSCLQHANIGSRSSTASQVSRCNVLQREGAYRRLALWKTRVRDLAPVVPDCVLLTDRVMLCAPAAPLELPASLPPLRKSTRLHGLIFSIADKGIMRRVKVLTPDTDKTLEPLLRVDVRRLRMAAHNEEILGVVDPFEASQGEHFVGSAMLKPCFSPFEPGICALATGALR